MNNPSGKSKKRYNGRLWEINWWYLPIPVSMFFFQIEVLTDDGDDEAESAVTESTTRPPDFNQFDGLFENDDEAEEEGGEEQYDRED